MRDRRLSALILSIAAILGLGVAVAVSPGVRLELRRSFTRLPSQYTELYLAQKPTVSHAARHDVVKVTVALVHHGTAPEAYAVQVAGKYTGSARTWQKASKTVPAAPDQVITTTFRLTPPRAKAPAATKKRPTYRVTVTLAGHPQSLHFLLTV